jgi:hypothetical protein
MLSQAMDLVCAAGSYVDGTHTVYSNGQGALELLCMRAGSAHVLDVGVPKNLPAAEEACYHPTQTVDGCMLDFIRSYLRAEGG